MEQCQPVVPQIANVAEEWFISCLGQCCKTNFLFILRKVLAALTQHKLFCLHGIVMSLVTKV